MVAQPFSEQKLYGRTRVPLRMIAVDDRYQRDPATQQEVRKLAAKWDEKAASVVTLSLRPDGSYWCIDGQRRVAACRLVKGEDADIEAQVWLDLTAREESALFSQLQDRKHLTPIDKFKADVFAGDLDACFISGTVRAAGFEVRAAHGKSAHAITAISMLYKVLRPSKPTSPLRIAHFKRVLRLLRDGDAERAPSGSALDGLSLFLDRYPQVDEGRLLDILHRLGLSTLMARAVRQREFQPSMTGGVAFGRALLHEYNQNLRSNRLHDWVDKMFGT